MAERHVIKAHTPVFLIDRNTIRLGNTYMEVTTTSTDTLHIERRWGRCRERIRRIIGFFCHRGRTR